MCPTKSLGKITNSGRALVSLNEAFILFAKENWRPDFEPSNPIGERLNANITDPSTRHLYTLLLSRLKENPHPFTLPYRCDSPDVKRYMELTITPCPDRSIDWRSRILREELRDAVPILDARLERGELLLRVCSWCKRCSVPEWLSVSEGAGPPERWVEVVELMIILGSLGGCRLPALTHTACPDCYRRVMAEIQNT